MTRTLPGLPRKYGYVMPPEWAPHAATWMSWPFDEDMWHGHLADVRAEYAALVKTLARFEQVHLLLRDAEARATAEAALLGSGSVHFHEVALDDVWLRDNGPIFITRRLADVRDALPSLSFVNWEFNSWGQKYSWQQDNQAPKAIAQLLDMPHFDLAVVMEGGSLDVNGSGACLTTEQCLLSPQRNPSLSKIDLEAYLRDYLALEQVIWLKQGLEGDHTDGHIDTISRFVDTHTVLTSVCEDKSDSNYEPMQENREILQGTVLRDGMPLRVIDLPLPRQRLELLDGSRLPATYANFYLTNGAVLVPQYGDPEDARALNIIQDAFPRHQIIGLPSRFIITGGGSFHCLTQQQPLV